MTRATSHPFMPHCILITGATGSIGGALAAEYAAPGTTLVLQGRNRARLQEIAGQCRGKGARVLVEDFDIRDHERLLAWLHEISETQPIDLVIVNAGVNINIGTDGEGEAWDEVLALIDVNIRAALATVHGVLPGMRRRGGGQIALISSLAAWRGLPETPSYSASKAALKVYGEALRDAEMRHGIRVNVVMPGYVESKMCFDMPGPKPFLWTAGKAARTIRAGLARNRARISFPFLLSTGCFLLSVIHPTVSGRILRWLNYGA